MAPRKKKPWNADLPLPEWAGGPPHVVKPAPDTISPSHSTPGAPASNWQCLRCERLNLGNDVTGLDHTPRCPWRGKGDPGFG